MSIRIYLKSLSIRSRILILVALGVLGVAGISGSAKYFAWKKNNYMSVLQQSQTVETVMLQIRMAEEKFISTLASEELSSLGEYRQKLDAALTQIKSFNVGAGIADDATAMAKTETEHAQIFQTTAKALDEISKAKADLFAKIGLVNTHFKRIIDAVEQEEAYLITQGETLPLDKDGLRKDLSDILVLLSDRVMNLQDLMLASNTPKFKENLQSIEKKLELRKRNINLIMPVMKEFMQPWQAGEPLLDSIKAIENTIAEQWDKNKELKKQLHQTAMQIQEKANGIAESSKLIIENSNSSADRISLLISLGGIAILFGLGAFISKSINRSLEKSISGLIDGSSQVAAVSGQVSISSQDLADGAARQRASLEETSSALEQVSAMTKQNAQNASQANQLMAETNQVIGKANQSMIALTESMGQISRANLETQKIIKTIDEIAFQTNLLALNAAVEAARAGEFGAGFAVVANEVRNLSMRAAEAAKNTAGLIEGTVKTVKDGSSLVVATSDEFNSAANAVLKSGELVGRIATASQEQSQEIEQLTKAVSDLDKVVERNAANAEESADAAEEMNSQAEQMKIFVNELNSLVGGSEKQGQPGALQPGATRLAGELNTRRLCSEKCLSGDD